MMEYDNTLFDNITIPTEADRELLVNNILARGAEFEVLYSNYDVLKSLINNWFKVYERTFTKWWNALKLEYNPIENYDRFEDESATNNSQSSSNGSSSGSSSLETQQSSYDSSSYQPDNKNIGADSNTYNNSATGAVNEHKVTHIHGNIGVTTSQQMLESELNLALWNWYEHVTDLFLQNFIIAVY